MSVLRKILFPFSLLYGGVTDIRNKLYDLDLLKSKQYDIPIICVGNLSTGGTGKTPMIELLIELLKDQHHIAVLSRGYGRNTKGYLTVSPTSSALEVGDEPLQFKKKFPTVKVAVCEDRQTGIEILKKNANLILLDDAFQHRKVKATINIMLTQFSKLYTDDLILPAGNLRESKSGANRADMIIVTKCPDNLDVTVKDKIKKKIKLNPGQNLFFTKIGYAEHLKSVHQSLPLEDLLKKKFTLVTGIAKPKPLVEYLKKKSLDFKHLKFKDHHNFSETEIKTLNKEETIVTTEKDYMRLQPLLKKPEVFYLPIKTQFLYNDKSVFENLVFESIKD